ncbi:MAG: phosphate acyltransferase PlsX [Pseudomonadota bacterium]
MNSTTSTNPEPGGLRLAVDAMGGDAGPAPVVAGAAQALRDGLNAEMHFFGPEAQLRPLLDDQQELASAKIFDADSVVSMTDKPMHVLRRGRDTSMWKAIEHVTNNAAHGLVSCGNTGALMAVARRQLGMIEGIERPAITAIWPTPKGRSVVLDVGANVEADEEQLVNFAIMGEAFFRALTGKERPTVGLLNVGSEELKGHELIRRAAKTLREADPAMAFSGFVEGNDISLGAVDVVVTDGFTGNIALKSAEGAARLVGGWMKEALTANILSKLGALLMRRQLGVLKDRIDPSSVNGGVFLGINGVVVKSHGSADSKGVSSAISMAAQLVGKGFRKEVAETVALVKSRRHDVHEGTETTSTPSDRPEPDVPQAAE